MVIWGMVYGSVLPCFTHITVITAYSINIHINQSYRGLRLSPGLRNLALVADEDRDAGARHDLSQPAGVPQWLRIGSMVHNPYITYKIPDIIGGDNPYIIYIYIRFITGAWGYRPFTKWDGLTQVGMVGDITRAGGTSLFFSVDQGLC